MSISQENSAALEAGADRLPAPEAAIVQRAHGWNSSRKEVIGATGQAKERARSKHRLNEQTLAEACDRAVRNAGAQP